MNEPSKTGIFAAVAALLAMLVYITDTPLSTNIDDEAQEKVGDTLFPELADSASVAGLKVVKYDESLGIPSEFEVTKDAQSGAWILPSHDSYPADAKEQIGKASNALIGVKILQLASSKADDQSLYGVVEPSADKTQVGATGVGTLVRMTDSKGSRLADLVIGKKVVGSDTQRYVRIPSTDQIWIADIDPASFPTDFKQWIDKDLLEISSTDIRQLDIRKYDLLVQRQGVGMSKEFDAVANFNTSDGKWTPGKIVRYVGGVDSPRELGPDEQLNAAKLNGIKTALDSLTIADVARKPEGLAANLKVDAKLMEDQASLLSLSSKGFFVPQSTAGNEIYSSSGELLVSLKDGVQYLLRFGDSANSIGKTEEENAEASAEDAEKKGVSVNRYLLVTAKLDESQIPEVALQKVPETIEELDAMEAAKKAAEQAAVPAYEAEPPVPPAPPIGESPAPAPESPAPQPPATDAGTTETPSEPAAPASTESSPAPSESQPATPAPADGSSNLKASKERLVAFQEQNQAEAEKAPDAAQAPEQPAPAATTQGEKPAAPAAQEETAQEKQERLEAAREKITKENQRKIDDRNDRIAAAKKKVDGLNAKFAEWYYVISETQYEKLTVSLDDLIQNKNAATPPSVGQPGAGDFFPGGGIPGFGNN